MACGASVQFSHIEFGICVSLAITQVLNDCSRSDAIQCRNYNFACCFVWV